MRLRLLLALALIAPAVAAPAVFGQAAEPEFVDWTAYGDNFTRIDGTLFGAAVTITGGAFHPDVPLDDNSTAFSGAAFSPPLARADAPELFGTNPAASYTITFGAPVRDPILHFATLASTLTFSDGTQIVKRSGALGVSGNRVLGTFPDVAGSVQLPGDHTSISFTALWSGPQPDGIDFAVGGTPVPPPVTATPTPPTPAPTPAPTVTPTPPVIVEPTPTPVAGVSVVGRPESGQVRARLPGAATFTPLAATQSLPVGATVDARKGAVTVVSAGGTGTDSARVAAGLFTIRQGRAAGSIPALVLATPAGLARACAPGRPRPPKGAVRTLSVVAKGTFRVVPKKGIVTGRNAAWTTTDRCDGTLTSVRRGRVTVRRGQRTIRVFAGRRYLIAARLFAARKARGTAL